MLESYAVVVYPLSHSARTALQSLGCFFISPEVTMPWATIETEERPPMRIYARKVIERMLAREKLMLRDIAGTPGPKPKEARTHDHSPRRPR